VATLITWPLGTFAFIRFWPLITISGFKRAIIKRGLGGGPIPVNTMYAVPDRSFQSASSHSLMATGTHDLVYLAGWLDRRLDRRSCMCPRWTEATAACSFADQRSGANFADVGKRTTDTATADFLLCQTGWNGVAPAGIGRIEMPHPSALLIGRVFAADEADRQLAHVLANRSSLAALTSSQWRLVGYRLDPGQAS
jgi:hypothetical protein